MKREHMVTFIAESLIEPRYPDDPIKEADVILKRIEKLGMVPPTYKKEYMTFDHQVDFILVNEWEPE